MGIFSSSPSSFGAGVFTGNSLGIRKRRKSKAKEKPAVGNLDGTRTQDDDHSQRSFRPN